MRRMMQTIAVLAAGSFGVTALAQDEYDLFIVDSFPVGGISEAYVNDINNNNIAVGRSTYQSFYAGFSWKEDTGKFLLPGTTSASNILENDLVLRGGALLDAHTGQVVQTFSGLPGNLADLTLAGTGVGYTPAGGSPGCEPFNCPFDCSEAFLFDGTNGVSDPIGVPSFKALYDINENDIAIGLSILTCDDERGIVYDLQTHQFTNLSSLLPPLPAVGRGAQTVPVAINNSEQVVGTALFGLEPERVFVWSDVDGFTFLPAIPNGELGSMNPNDINEHGEVVGSAYDVVNTESVAFIWDPQNGIRDLNTLVTTPNGFILNRATGLNDNGWIVGYGHYGPGWGVPKGFVLKPRATMLAADMNCDGLVSVGDIGPFVMALTEPASFATQFPDCDMMSGDLNDDGIVSVGDIGPFVAMMTK